VVPVAQACLVTEVPVAKAYSTDPQTVQRVAPVLGVAVAELPVVTGITMQLLLMAEQAVQAGSRLSSIIILTEQQ
jgi:hypothetical protein